MGQPSSPAFRTLHALRIKGVATAATLADMAQGDLDDIQRQLDDLAVSGLTRFQPAGALWQLTPGGRAAHTDGLRADVEGVLPDPGFADAYRRFVAADLQFDTLFAAWRVFNGEPNDHSSAEYDAAVIENLSHLHTATEPVVRSFGTVFDRMDGYGPRLESVLIRSLDGESNMFTGVMCGSYHDVWMELHEDLILTQGLEPSARGER
jgi:hypothetical protein